MNPSYIKEFVHGDFGRTKPNIGSLMNMTADILELDVEVNHFIVEMPIYILNSKLCLFFFALSQIVLLTLTHFPFPFALRTLVGGLSVYPRITRGLQS